MRAAIYCRVSTVEQASNLSLPTQEKACREYCARSGYDVDQVFVDAGESAKTTDRPEFLRLLEYCRQHRGRLHAVIVYSLTRFSRNSTDHHAIASLLRGLGIMLRSVTEPIDDSPSGRLMEGILAAMAQFDNDVRAARTVDGMKAAVERGRWVWAAPLGYRTGETKRGASLVLDPERGPAVREAFALCAAGVTGRALLERMTALGLRTRRGGALTIGRLYALLRNPVYAGAVRSPAWQTERRGDFEALVSDEAFARVQVRLARRSRLARQRHRHVNHPDFPLRRFVRCAHCDHVLSGSNSRGKGGRYYGFYHCARGCTRVPRRRLEDRFLELLDALRPRAEYWAVLRAAVLDTWRTARAQAASVQTTARTRLAGLQTKLQRLEDAYIYRQAIDDASYRRRRDELREAIALATIDASQADAEEIDVEGMLAFAEHALQHASAIWTAAAGVEDKIKVQWTYFPMGLVWESGELEHFRAPVTCLDFYQLGEPATSQDGVVSPLYLTWNPALAWLRHLYQALPHAA